MLGLIYENNNVIFPDNCYKIEQVTQKQLNLIFKNKSRVDFDRFYLNIELPIEELIMLEIYENIEIAVISKFNSDKDL